MLHRSFNINASRLSVQKSVLTTGSPLEYSILILCRTMEKRGNRSFQRRLRSFLGSSAVTAALTLSSQSGFCVANSGARCTSAAFVSNFSREKTVQATHQEIQSLSSRFDVRTFATVTNDFTGGHTIENMGEGEEWNDVLPFENGSHNSAKIAVPVEANGDVSGDVFDRTTFRERLGHTIEAVRELEKSSVWVEVPMSRASLIEDMGDLGFEFHHAHGNTAKLNLWLKESESKIPEFATHHVGVGAVVVNSRQEILCVRELRRNFLPWKIPGGLSDLGEQIPEAAEREVLEETGIRTQFHSILSFRHSHGMANGRSDLYFVCRLDPIEETDGEGNVVIPVPTPQECEIERAEWIPMPEYREMINGVDGGHGHPMMKHVMDMYDQGKRIKKRNVMSVVPGRAPNPIYQPDSD